MNLSKYSTPAEVVKHHPKMVEFEDQVSTEIPKLKTGPNACFERVVMRRHLREFFPGFCSIIEVQDLDHDQLVSAIRRLSTESMDTM